MFIFREQAPTSPTAGWTRVINTEDLSGLPMISAISQKGDRVALAVNGRGEVTTAGVVDYIDTNYSHPSAHDKNLAIRAHVTHCSNPTYVGSSHTRAF